MPRRLMLCLFLAALSCAAVPAFAESEPEVQETQITARIDGRNITFDITCQVVTQQPGQWVEIARGAVVLDELTAPAEGYKLRFDPDTEAYRIGFTSAGRHRVSFSLAAEPAESEHGDGFREATFEMPPSRVRRLEVVADRVDLEVDLLGAVRVERTTDDGELRITGVQGSERNFAVRWKPKVRDLDAELVFATQSNTIARVGAGAVRLDSVIRYDVAQGRMEALELRVPKGLSVTQVRGPHIRDWRVEAGGDDADAVLRVTLSRAQRQTYVLQALGESPLDDFPATHVLPVVEPVGGIRAGGHLAVGTDSAIELVVDKAAGVSQIDAAAMPRVNAASLGGRGLPAGKVFYYRFASGRYAVQLKLDHIVPSFDAAQRIAVRIDRDDLVVDAQVELDIRDAPLRGVALRIPDGLTVVSVAGPAVDDHTVEAKQGAEGDAAAARRINVRFAEPVLGRTVVALRLEMGRSPLNESIALSGIGVDGAAAVRGFLAVATEDGIELPEPKANGGDSIRPVNTASSVPLRVPGAKHAYRLRGGDWGLTLRPTAKPASIGVETFHLLALGEGVAYGNVALSYYITGSPVDQFTFEIDPALRHVEFVGSDVRSARQDPDNPSRYTVTLQRRVIGDYNLGITYTQRFADGKPALAGGVRCTGVASQAGFVALASHLNLTLESDPPDASALMPIEREELPANYRLLVGAPLLASFKHIGPADPFSVQVKSYERGELLPVVVEMAQLKTQIVPRGGGEAEASTAITFKVKNSSSQFMALNLPGRAELWSVRLLEPAPRHADGSMRFDESGRPVVNAQRINASVDESTGRVLIPLRRPRDPNLPMTIEVVYGEVRAMSGFAGRMKLVAPSGSVVSTFDAWEVRVPEDWALHEAGSTAELQPRPQHHGSSSALLGAVVRAWGQANSRAAQSGRLYWGLGAAFAVGLLVLLVARRFLPAALVAVVLAGAVVLGVAAVQGVSDQQIATPDRLTTLHYNQVLSGDEARPIALNLSVVPVWRQYATVTSAVVVPLAALALLLLSIRARRARPILIAADLAGLFYAACHLPALTLPLAHVLTWGVPSALLAAVLWRMWGTRAARPGVGATPAAAPAALALLVGALAVTGCETTKELVVDSTTPVLGGVELELTAEDDAMAGQMRLTVDAAEPMRFDVFEPGTVVMDFEGGSDQIELDQVDGRYQLVVKRAGTYRLTVSFLRPLPEADAQQRRWFAMPLPPAVTNQVTLNVPGQRVSIQSPSAVRLEQADTEQGTSASAVIRHGAAARFDWRPRERDRETEAVAFYARTTGLVRFDAGLVEQRSRVALQIAQGQLDHLSLTAPAGMTVTAVDGEGVGAWRFDPATRGVEARLTKPATGQYELMVTMQRPLADLPESVALGRVEVAGAQNQRSALGLVLTDAVYLQAEDQPATFNTDDFSRDAAALLQPIAGTIVGGVNSAFRMQGDTRVVVGVHAVQPELRTIENTALSISDERIVLNATLSLVISKAGRFSVDLVIPEGYDIDALTAPQVSHWDEQTIDGQRFATVHFRQRTLGRVDLQAALSRPVADLPQALAVPRLVVPQTLKHQGQLIVTSAQGVRVAVTERAGVSELDPVELGIRAPGTLAFRLLRPDWSLTVGTEVIAPVVTVEALHVARVKEGVIGHDVRLRHSVRHAGIRQIDLRVPAEAAAVVITGPGIARTWQPDEADPRLHRVELASKHLGEAYQAYPLSVRYETRFDRDAGDATIEPVVIQGVERQRGYVVVMASPRVEVNPAQTAASLQPDEARTIPRGFGAGDLSNAALRYRASAADYTFGLSVTRHASADLLAASVRSAALTSVITDHGDAIHHLHIEMSVGGKRHLEAALPDGAEVWSLLVNGRSSVPSVRTDPNTGRTAHLIPLRPDAAGELPVQIEMIFAVEATSNAWSTASFEGPQFDLPLHNVTWTLFAPPSYAYSDFDGTLTHQPTSDHVVQYTAGEYEQVTQRQSITKLARALDLQAQGNKLADEGRQQAARQALEAAWYYSQSDVALNEDARVQLQKLAREQALVGLVGTRGRLRQQAGVAAPDQAFDEDFERDEARRLRSSLSKADSENLDAIIARMIETQEAAAAAGVPLYISLPVRGRPLTFTRAIQVEPYSPMVVRFDTGRPAAERFSGNAVWAGGAFLVLLVAVLLARPAWRALAVPPRDAIEPDDESALAFDSPAEDPQA